MLILQVRIYGLLLSFLVGRSLIQALFDFIVRITFINEKVLFVGIKQQKNSLNMHLRVITNEIFVILYQHYTEPSILIDK